MLRILHAWIEFNNTSLSSVICHIFSCLYDHFQSKTSTVWPLLFIFINTSPNISCYNIFLSFFVLHCSHFLCYASFLLPGDAVKTNKNTQMWFFFLIHVWRVCSSCWHPPLPPPPPQRTLLPLRTDHARLFHPQEEIKLINWFILAPKCVFLVNWWIIQCFHLWN